MKRKSKLTKRINWLCSIMLVLTILSCKQEEIKPSDAESSKNAKIQMLKSYLSDLVGADTANISYNVTTRMFSIAGVEQMSIEKLEELYTHHPVLHYKNGVAVPNN